MVKERARSVAGEWEPGSARVCRTSRPFLPNLPHMATAPDIATCSGPHGTGRTSRTFHAVSSLVPLPTFSSSVHIEL